MNSRLIKNRYFFWLTLLVISIVLSIDGHSLFKSLGIEWLSKYPSHWVFSLKDSISSAMEWLIEEANFGLFTFKELTRGIAWLIDKPYQLVLSLLSTGFINGVGNQANQILPPLSWLGIIAFIVALGHLAKDWGLAILVGACFFYLALFGQWDSAMITLTSVLIAVPIGVIGGLFLGIWAYRYATLHKIIFPFLDLMQTIPIFAYLVPILFMFGFGPVSALVATIIYAMPPMVRITTHALQNVDPEITEFGRMSGCTQRQLTWKIMIPTALSSLMVGVNQVIMLSLNMVIIASMIGAGGLGHDVLAALRRLDIGAGFEAGIAIVVLAIAVDRLSQAFALRTMRNHPDANASLPFFKRYPRATITLTVFIVTMILGKFVPILQTFPESQTLTTGDFWNDTIKYLNINFYETFESIKLFFLLGFMIPIKKFLLGIPWSWTICMLLIISGMVGGKKLAIMTLLMSLFILTAGLWEKAMITVYLCGSSVMVASALGIPLGILAGINKPAGKVIGVFIDTLQTLPSFVYLIPVVMLFRVGDFTAMVAIVLYALAPAVRYTIHGIRSIRPDLIEAGVVSGCTPRQLLTHIKLPLALPDIMLGLNQTIMLALSMLVITALVGTRDLGQEVYIALTRADTGHGLVAGLSIAFIAIIADRIISASARKTRIRLGLEATNG